MFITDDTIVAISSPPGSGARAVVRASGPAAIALSERVFTPNGGSLSDMPGFSASDGLLRMESVGMELPARAYLFRRPRSFTRQDVVELHLPGPAPVANALIDELIRIGAREAEPGEFTARAFFSGRIDLSAAEAVADVINAADEGQLRAAVASLEGSVWRFCSDAASRIADVLASVEASIDLADEQIALDDPRDLAQKLGELSGQMRDAAETARSTPETADQPVVVITGRPNVGKSSLLNALSGTDRAIVSVLAGTTRDVLSATMSLPDGGAILLLDAAGFRAPVTPLERAVHHAARRAVARADVVIFVIDASAARTTPQGDLELFADVRRTNPSAPVILLGNKIDLQGDPSAIDLSELEGKARSPVMLTSGLTGQGLPVVGRKIAEILQASPGPTGQVMGLHLREKRCLTAGARAADRAANILQSAAEVVDVAELAAIELREALNRLGRISGQIVDEDILGRIFSRFCVGK